MNMIQKIKFGFLSFWKGFFLFKEIPGIIKLCIIPFIIDVVVVIVGIKLGWGKLSPYISHFFHEPTSQFWIYFNVILKYLIYAFYLFFLFVFTVILANIISSPFHMLISEKTLIHLKVLQPRKFYFLRWIWISIQMVIISILRVIVLGSVNLVFIVLSFIPGFQPISAMFGLLILSLDFSDYAMENLEFGFKKRFVFYQKWKYEFIGFSIGLGMLFLIPGLNIILLPILVISATHLIGILSLKEIK